MYGQQNVKFNEVECVYSAVGTEILTVLQINLISYRVKIDTAFFRFS